MAYEYTCTRRVAFAETDMAGILHFSNFFRYMEDTEHAFFRSIGLSIHARHGEGFAGWPRVRVECDYLAPLRFEDEVRIHLLVEAKTDKSIRYRFVFRKVNEQSARDVARGTMTTVYVEHDPAADRMRAKVIPASIADRIETAPADLLE